jgi:excinuclease UvrABC nuclease subunit
MVPEPGIVLDSAAGLATLPEIGAVYRIVTREERSYIGRTGVLRRRLMRIWTKWNLAGIAARVEIWPAASRLEQWMISYALARRDFPADYERVLRLGKPPYLRIIGSNRFPRTQVTTRLGGSSSAYFGPFPSRAAADQFENDLLDLYQLRRCQEDLSPSPGHPGCIYGEMNRCLRPCQQAVSEEEYASEAARVHDFLATRGACLLDQTAASRDRYSEQLLFEEAARQHARYQKIEQVSRSAGELAREVTTLHGVAVTASYEPNTVALWFLREGEWQPRESFPVAPVAGKPVPLDARLREIAARVGRGGGSAATRQEHVALLAKWFYSSWRDGEWLPIASWDAVPYRKLVNAVHRVAKASTAGQ